MASPSLGHRHGATKALDVLRWCREMNVQYVTVFAASIDNLTKRDKEEIAALMNLIEEFVAERLAQQDARLHLAGRLELIPASTAQIIRDAIAISTTFSSDQHLTAALGYDGRTEILDAVRAYLRRREAEGATIDEVIDTITPDDIAAHLYTNHQPHPELVIRTSGEARLSTFMPWQTAYSHLYFCAAPWPALRRRDIRRAVRRYAADLPTHVG